MQVCKQAWGIWFKKLRIEVKGIPAHVFTLVVLVAGVALPVDEPVVPIAVDLVCLQASLSVGHALTILINVICQTPRVALNDL